MLELSHLDLELFEFAARLLVYLALSSAIFKPGFAKLFEALDPTIHLLVANVILDGSLSIITAISNTFLYDLYALFFSGFPLCLHTASS